MTIKKYVQFTFQKFRHILYLFWVYFYSKSARPNLLIDIDIIIPIIEKDLEILPLCLEGLKNNIKHNIKNIYIVAPNNTLIKEFVKVNKLLFIDESTVLGYTPTDINYNLSNGLNRSGWIFQQLIKLSGQIGTTRFFLVIDADHILLKPHVFINEDYLKVFYQSSEYHMPYYKSISKLIKHYPISLFSYVSHKMIFDKEELKALHLKIERDSNTKLSWDQVILSTLDINESSCFSEFELYGNFVDKKNKILVPWRQKTLNKTLLVNYGQLKNQYSKYLSVTFPSYLK